MDDGSEFTLTAVPATGYRFTSWSGCTPISAASCVVQIQGNRSVTATFTSSTPPPPPPPAGTTTVPAPPPSSTQAPTTTKKKKRHHRR